MKKKYLNNEFWSLTFGGAFQRTKVYMLGDEEKKKEFKSDLRFYVENTLLPQYKESKVDEETHVKNIMALSNETKAHSGILTNGVMNFGVSQKLLNLYLKYNWCSGEIEEPPHFPVDRVIQLKFREIIKENKTELKPLTLKPWTQIEDSSHYVAVINCAREITEKIEVYKGKSLPELELELFQRRSDT